jgi:hypothetical protein
MRKLAAVAIAGSLHSNGIRDRHDRACQRKSSLLDLRHLIVRTSGKPEVRCHPRLGCGTKDVDARDEPAHDGYKRAEPAIAGWRLANLFAP